MLFLLFRIGEDRYVLEAGRIEQVLPLMDAKAVPGAPPGVVGLLNYHGEPAPLIDLSLMAIGRPSARAMSTRILLIRYPDAASGPHRLALCAEQVVAAIHRDPEDFVITGVEAGAAPYLGPVASDEDGLIQWVRPEALLNADIAAILFQPAIVS
jgi:chemotaxis-related protein WspB